MIVSTVDREIYLGMGSARAGATPHVTRYVLSITLLLIVILFAALSLIWQ